MVHLASTLLELVQWSSANNVTTAATWNNSLRELKQSLASIDPELFRKRRCFWRDMISYMALHEPGTFVITCDPAQSKPRF